MTATGRIGFDSSAMDSLRMGAGVTALRFALLALVACAGSPAAPAEPWDPAARLTGRWAWVSSADVQRSTMSTPETAGYTAELEFWRTSASSGTFRFVKSGADTIDGTFGIGSEDARGHDFIVIEPSIPYLARNAWLAIGDESLGLGGVMEGGFNSTYVRIR